MRRRAPSPLGALGRKVAVCRHSFQIAEMVGGVDVDQKETSELLNILVSGAFGALAGALMSLVVNFWIDWNKRRGLRKNLMFEPQEKRGCRVTARIHNGYVLPLSNVYAYISVEHGPSDVLHPPLGYRAYIVPGDHKFEEDRLCWSMAGNPPHVDIYAGEKQSLEVLGTC